jgi:hypothetical protein
VHKLDLIRLQADFIEDEFGVNWLQKATRIWIRQKKEVCIDKDKLLTEFCVEQERAIILKRRKEEEKLEASRLFELTQQLKRQ